MSEREMPAIKLDTQLALNLIVGGVSQPGGNVTSVETSIRSTLHDPLRMLVHFLFPNVPPDDRLSNWCVIPDIDTGVSCGTTLGAISQLCLIKLSERISLWIWGTHIQLAETVSPTKMDKSSFQGQPPQPHKEPATTSTPTANCLVCNEPPSKTLTPGSPKSIRSQRSRISNISTISTIRRKNLELQRLEEERQLAKERDTEFLKQKYKLLQQTEEEDVDTSSQDLNSVHEWLNTQPNPPNSSETNPHFSPQNCPTENQHVTFTTSMFNQCQVATQTSQNNMPIQHILIHPSQHILIHPSCVQLQSRHLNCLKGLQATIEACGLLEELNNPSLLQDLISKLPSHFQINWGTYKLKITKENKNVNLSEFSDWIFDIGVSASSVNIESSTSSATRALTRSKSKNVYIHTHTEQSRKMAWYVVATATIVESNENKSCRLCINVSGPNKKVHTIDVRTQDCTSEKLYLIADPSAHLIWVSIIHDYVFIIILKKPYYSSWIVSIRYNGEKFVNRTSSISCRECNNSTTLQVKDDEKNGSFCSRAFTQPLTNLCRRDYLDSVDTIEEGQYFSFRKFESRNGNRRSSDDTFTFKITQHMANNILVDNKIPTKRELLRILMSIYDPLGLIGHYLMYLKIILQDVWRSNVTWDEEIQPCHMVKKYCHTTMLSLTFSSYDTVDVELTHIWPPSGDGFSNGINVVVSLVGSKTRVAPLKVTSIPRLELMGAVIASRFANSIVKSMTINISRMVFWSDSKTVLSWLRSDQRKYHQFVAFRVSEIIDTTELDEWRWISGKLNVADEATKWSKSGPDLSNGSRWQNDPVFLKQNQNSALRAVAYVIHYVNKLKNKKNPNTLSQEEIKKAEVVLLKQAQMEVYMDEIKAFKCNSKISKSSPLYKLSAYLDGDEVLRINSRIDYANVPCGLNNPAIIPKQSYVTELIILHFHAHYHHGNHETAINEIRQVYYVPRLRTTFKKVIRKCQMCKISKAEPTARLSAHVAPFTFTGLDFFGPLRVTVNRHKEKEKVRSPIHLFNYSSRTYRDSTLFNHQLMHLSNTEFYGQAWYSTGACVVGAERELRECINEINSNEFVRNFTSATNIWERMVRSIKTVLYKIPTSRSPNDETICSMMAEIENIINSRPLTYVPIDNENQEALTPNNLLLGSSNGMKPLADYDDGAMVVKGSWLQSQIYAQQFWRRWLSEYLPSLACRTKWFEKSKPLTVGDLVVVVDPSSPRNVLPRGKVLETTVAKDGQVRRAMIKTTCVVLERPVANKIESRTANDILVILRWGVAATVVRLVIGYLVIATINHQK
ncbi:hypothetical protein CVS40_8253 [Lucilia cuprina]|nr:hypothetical protein CVS40_8253 [Lucilia cuprina]